MKKACVFIVCALALLYTGCVTASGPTASNPENGVLVYGVYELDGYRPISFVSLYQLDPSYPPVMRRNIMPNYKGIMTVVLPPGGFYKLLGFQLTGLYQDIIWHLGIQGVNNWDITLPSEPGLHYAGSWMYTDDGIVEDTRFDELSVLKSIEVMYKGSAWGKLITSRIQELENE